MFNELKLNLGSGEKHIHGWHNLDANNEHDFCVTCLTRSIQWSAPYLRDYDDESVDFIYNEHFIEHLDEVDGFIMLTECFRTLKKGGVLRICAPSIDRYVSEFLKFDKFNLNDFRNSTQFLNYAIYGEGWKNGVGVRYLRKIEGSKYEDISYAPCDHKYIYSISDITEKLEKIGFSSIEEKPWGFSEISIFNGLENHPGRLEMILQAVK